MKYLKDKINLSGEQEELTIMELRAIPGEIFTQVELGKIFVIKRKNKVLGAIVPLPNSDVYGFILPNGVLTYNSELNEQAKKIKIHLDKAKVS